MSHLNMFSSGLFLFLPPFLLLYLFFFLFFHGFKQWLGLRLNVSLLFAAEFLRMLEAEQESFAVLRNLF